MGLKVVTNSNKTLEINTPDSLPPRSVRIREKDDNVILTIKEKRTAGAEIDNRLESEVHFPNLESAQSLLISSGYEQKSIREKYRTSYKVSNGLVELNEGPVGQPWAEVEGETPAEVKKIVELLGYTTEDTASMSDTDYYKSQGIPSEDLSNLVFQGTKRPK